MKRADNRALDEASFDAKTYTQGCFVDLDEDQIKAHRYDLLQRSEAAADELRKIVKGNFTNFIGISREIITIKTEASDLKDQLGEVTDLVRALASPTSAVFTKSKRTTQYHTSSNTALRKSKVDEAVSNPQLQKLLFDLEVVIAEREWPKAEALASKLQQALLTPPTTRQDNSDDENNNNNNNNNNNKNSSKTAQAIVLRTQDEVDTAVLWVETVVSALLADLDDSVSTTASRAAVIALLDKMGFLTEGQAVILANQSRWIRVQVQKIKFKGDLSEFVGQLCHVVFSGIVQMMSEQENLFSSPDNSSRFVCWAFSEIRGLLAILADHVFNAQRLKDIHLAITVLKGNTAMVEQRGLSCGHMVLAYLHSSFAGLVQKHFAQAEDTVAAAVQTELWTLKALHLKSSADGSKKTLELTASATALYESLEKLLEELRELSTIAESVNFEILNKVSQLFDGYLTSLAQWVRSGTLNDQQCLAVIINAQYIAEDLIPRTSQSLTSHFRLPLADVFAVLGSRLEKCDAQLVQVVAGERAGNVVTPVFESWVKDRLYSAEPELDPVFAQPSPSFFGVVARLSELRLSAQSCHLNQSLNTLLMEELIAQVIALLVDDLWLAADAGSPRSSIADRPASSSVFVVQTGGAQPLWRLRSVTSSRSNIFDDTNDNNADDEDDDDDDDADACSLGFGGVQQLMLDLRYLCSVCPGSERLIGLATEAVVFALCRWQKSAQKKPKQSQQVPATSDPKELVAEWESWCIDAVIKASTKVA